MSNMNMLRPIIALARAMAADLKWIDVNAVAEAGDGACAALIRQIEEGMARNPGFDPARLVVKDGILHIGVPRPYGRVKVVVGQSLRMDVSGGDHAWFSYCVGGGGEHPPAVTLGGRAGQALAKRFIEDMPAEVRADVRALLAEAVF